MPWPSTPLIVDILVYFATEIEARRFIRERRNTRIYPKSEERLIMTLIT